MFKPGDVVQYKGAAYASARYRVTKVSPGGGQVTVVRGHIGTSHVLPTDRLEHVDGP